MKFTTDSLQTRSDDALGVVEVAALYRASEPAVLQTVGIVLAAYSHELLEVALHELEGSLVAAHWDEALLVCVAEAVHQAGLPDSVRGFVSFAGVALGASGQHGLVVGECALVSRSDLHGQVLLGPDYDAAPPELGVPFILRQTLGTNFGYRASSYSSSSSGGNELALLGAIGVQALWTPPVHTGRSLPWASIAAQAALVVSA